MVYLQPRDSGKEQFGLSPRITSYLRTWTVSKETCLDLFLLGFEETAASTSSRVNSSEDAGWDSLSSSIGLSYLGLGLQISASSQALEVGANAC